MVLDRVQLTSVITLGGHHWLVLSLAGAGFLLLAAMAPMTGGFVEVDRTQAVLIAVAGAVSAAALAGAASVVGLVSVPPVVRPIQG